MRGREPSAAPPEPRRTYEGPRPSPFGTLSWTNTFEALRFRDFRLLWYGHACNSIGQWMDQVARGWLMYQLTDSPLQLGLVAAVRAVPTLFFSVLAGTLADRYSRKKQLIIAQLINAVLNLIVGVLAVTGHIQPWHLYATGILAGIVMAFQQPARQSLVPELVDRAHLTNAIGLNSVSFNASRTVGPALAGILIATAGVGESYLVQAAIYGLSTVWTMQMRVPSEARVRIAGAISGDRLSVWASTLEGGRYIWGNRAIRTVMLIALVPTVLGQPYGSLMPVFTRDVLHVGATGQGLLLTAAGVGALGGASLLAMSGDLRRRGMLMMAGAGLFGLCLIGFAAAEWFPLSLGLMGVAGLSNVAYGALANTVVQEETPPELRGRVMGIYMLDRGLVPLGSLVAGAMATVWGAPWTVALMGIACTLLVAGIFVAVPEMRELE